MLRDRLIFGTARLSGGPYAPVARTLIALCLDGGITAFDTAPSYGMGAAEALLGQALAGRRDVRIATKVGAPRPRWPAVRGWLKRGRRLGGSTAALTPAVPPPYRAPAAGYRFDPESVRASLRHSLAALQRDRVALLLLHEARPEDVPDAAAMLTEAMRDGRAAAVGYAHGGTVDGRPPPAGWTVQAAAGVADLTLAGDGAPRIFHTIRSAARAASCDTAAGPALAKWSAALGAGDPDARRFVATLLALHRRDPGAGLIVATTRPDRLRALLALVDRVEAEGLDR